MHRSLATVLAAVTLAAAPAFAGIAGSPLPVLDPAGKIIHLYSVPGVHNDGGANLGTFFSCTSTAAANQTVGVEGFPAAGGAPLNNVQTSKVIAAPGQTVTIGTTSSLSLVTDSALGRQGEAEGRRTIVAKTKRQPTSTHRRPPVRRAAPLAPRSG